VTPKSPGPGVDAEGRPVIDPTRNVLDLVEAAVKRIDDIRVLEAKYQRELIQSESTHQTAMANLRGEFGEKLRNAESARIDAIRAVDVGAVQRAAEVSAAQAQTLANQVAVSAEALRAQVSAAQSAAATSLAAALDPIIASIADLRRAQYEAQGQKINVTETRTSTTALWAAAGVAISLLFLLVAIAGLLLTRK
jgi:hypothetical protein